MDAKMREVLEKGDAVLHDDQSNIFDFMDKSCDFCLNCRFVVDFRCTNTASRYFGADTRCSDVEFEKCDHRFSCIESENMKNSDDETGDLI